MEPYQEDLAIIAKLRQDMADNADVMRVCVIAECALIRRDGTPRPTGWRSVPPGCHDRSREAHWIGKAELVAAGKLDQP
jgi:hypothetical protein